MNKLFTKIAGLSLGLAMAIGVGVGLGQNKASEAKAAVAPINTVLWGENFAHFGTKTPSAAGTGNGTTIYDGATVTYTQSSTNTKGYNENSAGGTAPELLLSKNNQTWTISGIKSGNAKGMSLTFLSNKTTFSLTCDSDAYKISGSEKSWSLALGEGRTAPATFGITLKNTSSGSNARIDNIELKVTTAGQEATSYNVSFNANGGSGNMTTVSTTSPYEAPECGFTAPTNKAFAYWTVGAAGTGTHYAVGDEITFTSNIELYANWSDAYTVTFNSNGGSGLMNPVTVGNPYKAPKCEFTAPANKQFAYWTVGAAGTGTHYAVGDEITLASSTTLFANWEDKPLEETLTIPGGTTTQNGSTNTTWTDSNKVSGTWVKDVHFEGLGSGTNDTKYYKSDQTWRFYSEGSSGVKVTVPEGFYITKVTITFNKGNIVVPQGMTTSDSASPMTYTAVGDEKASYSFCRTSANLQIKSIKVSYAATVITYPTKATVEYKTQRKVYFNGTSSASKFTPASDLLVKTLTDDDKIKDDNVTNYSLSLRKNGNEIWNNSTDASITFSGFEPSSTTVVYTILVTVIGVGEGGANVNSDGTLVLTINDKQPTKNAFKFESAPAQSYVSHLDEFAIKGTLVCGYTDGTSAISSELMKLDLFEGSTASGNAVYSIVDTEETKDVNRIYNVLKSENGLIVNSGLDFCDDSFVLKYNSVTQFTYRITLLKYSTNNYFDTTVTIYPITLTAEDNSEQTYYKGGTYEMSAIVTAHWNNNAGSKVLDSSLYEINGGEAFEPTEVKDGVEISVALVNDSAKTTTYNVDVIAPSTPKHLEILLADDYKAGNKFHLGADAEVTFEGVTDPQDVPYDSSEMSYSLVLTTTSEFDDGIEITPNTPMLLSYEGKYIIARYTMGDNHVDSDAELVEKVAPATIEDYTPAGDPTWTKVTDASSLVAGDTIIIAYTSDIDGYTAGDITSEYLSSCESEFSSDLKTIKELNNDSIEFVLGGTTGSWTLANSDDSTQLLGATAVKKLAWNKGTTTWSISITGGNATIQNGTESYGRFLYNSGSPRFTTYTSATSTSMLLPQIYKKNQTPAVGDVVDYLESVIDAYRLNNELTGGLSICDAETGIYSSDDWTKAKAAFKGLNSSELLELSIQDRFGETGKTYVDTYNKLISLDPSEVSNPLSTLMNSFGSSNTSIVIVIISVIGIAAIGGYFYYKKRKEN